MTIALAIAMALIAELSKAWIDDRIGRDSGFVIPYLGVIVAAVVGGLMPGLLATALVAGIEAFAFLPPDGISVGDPVDQARLALFVLGGVLMSALSEVARRGRFSTELARTAERASLVAAERSAGRARALADLSAALNRGLDRDAIAAAALEHSVRVVDADRGAFYTIDPDGGNLHLAGALGYPESTLEPYRSVPISSPLPAAVAARTALAVLIGDPEEYRARLPDVAVLVPDAPTVAMAAQPLLADGRLLGVLAWAFTSAQTFDAETAEFLEAIASLTVQAIQGAAALEREQRARHQVEDSNRRLDLIVQAGQALGATLDYEATLLAMARAAIPLLGDVCVVDMLEDDGVRRFVASADPGRSELAATLERYPVDAGSEHPVARAIRDRVTIVQDVDDDLREHAAQDGLHRAAIAATGIQRILVVPLVVRERAIGALTFATADRDRRYDDADIAVAGVLAQRAAKATENARLHLQVRALASHERARAGELESVLAAIGEGIVVVGPDGRVHSANRAAERFLGGPVKDLSDISQRLLGVVRDLRPGEPFGPDELRLSASPGTWVELAAYPTGRRAAPDASSADPDPDDDPIDDATGSVLVIRDVTAFRQGQGLREAFLGLLSHELRTPVTSIYAAATVLGQPDRALGHEVRQDILNDIVAESDRLYRLVEDLLVLARFDEGLELVREPSLLQRVVPNVIRSEAPRWPRTRLEVAVQRDLPAVMGDETTIQQVIRNLVSNAAKYGPPGQPVEIQVGARDRDGVEVRVLDRGPGVDIAETEAIFAPFYRSPSTARVAAGAGIGLFVCRRLVEAMGGRIWARSRDGGGSEFGFWLPRYVQGADEDAEDGEPEDDDLTTDRTALPEAIAGQRDRPGRVARG